VRNGSHTTDHHEANTMPVEGPEGPEGIEVSPRAWLGHGSGP